MAGAAPRLTVSGSRCFHCCWLCLVSMFVFDVVPVIPCALLCQAWPLHPVLPHAGLGLTAWCRLPTAGARSQLLGWLPSSHCPRAPRLLPGHPRGSECLGTSQRACAQVTVSPQLVWGRVSTEMQGRCWRNSIYHSVLHHFVFFADILDTSRVISEDGKKKVGAVCKAWWLLYLSPVVGRSHWLLWKLSQLW